MSRRNLDKIVLRNMLDSDLETLKSSLLEAKVFFLESWSGASDEDVIYNGLEIHLTLREYILLPETAKKIIEKYIFNPRY
nr:hypothetical protein [Candidatus Freyarchaeota archaeon]